MADQLAYAIITPYSLHKSRTGGILSRLLSRTGLDLAAARMFAPSAELIKKYSEATISANDPQDRRIQELIYNYILNNLSPDAKIGKPRRVGPAHAGRGPRTVALGARDHQAAR